MNSYVYSNYVSMPETSAKDLFDKFHRVNSSQSDIQYSDFAAKYYSEKAVYARSLFDSYRSIQERVAFYKHKVTADLADFLLEFESKATSNGIKIIYAENQSSAICEIDKILKRTDSIFLDGSPILDEIDLDSHFRSAQRAFEYLFPYRSHYKVEEKELYSCIGDLSRSSSDLDKSPSHEQALFEYKSHLLEKMFSESVLISGTDFLVCDSGAIVHCDHTGLFSAASSFCLRQIVVAGIDQLIPSIGELDYFLALLSSHCYGQLRSWNNQICFGPRQTGEADGPYEVYVILVDNGRTEVLKDLSQRTVFNCIGCQACTAVCPVLKYVNSYEQKQLFSPLDLIRRPIVDGFDKAGFLPFSCTLCGKCTDICPSLLNFQDMIHCLRHEVIQKADVGSLSRKSMKTLRKMLLRRKSMNLPYHRLLLRINFKKRFGSEREFPDFNKKSFHYCYTKLEN